MIEECQVGLRRGALRFSRRDYDRFLAGIEAVVLLRDGADLLILPVREAHAGGYLLKQANLAGDRTAHVAGFLRDQGADDEVELTRSAAWNEERAALILAGFFGLQT